MIGCVGGGCDCVLGGDEERGGYGDFFGVMVVKVMC